MLRGLVKFENAERKNDKEHAELRKIKKIEAIFHLNDDQANVGRV